ncbi:TRI37 ligase, partial [Ptilorrhoa leucosticta]|nr:TRI37 ligase [Ptilorrhoa leucosticta]
SGENDVEYSSTMELEDGDLMEDAAAAATPGASGMKNDSRIPIKAKHCWIPSPAPLGSNAKLRVLQAVLFWELLHHVVCTDYCKWFSLPAVLSAFSFGKASSYSLKDRDQRRHQAMWRVPPDLKMLKRLKTQMAEVRSKMSDVKNQLSEVRSSNAGSGEGQPSFFSIEQGALAACGTDSCSKLQEIGMELLTKSSVTSCYIRN